MNIKLEEIKQKIRNINKVIEKSLDDFLPDTYAYIGNYVQKFSYTNNIPINFYEVKELVNKAFAIINKQALPNIEGEIYQMLWQLEKEAEENIDLTRTLTVIKEKIIDAVNGELKKSVRIGLMRFEDEFSWNYARKINTDDSRYLNRVLIIKLDELMNENIKETIKNVNREMDNIIDDYRIINNKDKEDIEDNNIYEDTLNQIYLKYNKEINTDENVKKIYLELKSFYEELINKGITKENISAWDLSIMKNLEEKFNNAISEYNIKEEKQIKENQNTEKTFVDENGENEMQSQISIINNMNTLTDEQKSLLINQIIENLELNENIEENKIR